MSDQQECPSRKWIASIGQSWHGSQGLFEASRYSKILLVQDRDSEPSGESGHLVVYFSAIASVSSSYFAFKSMARVSVCDRRRDEGRERGIPCPLCAALQVNGTRGVCRVCGALCTGSGMEDE